ncbi:MAG: TAT-variant-translocated molybdopterin oxidoreductase [Phycisphaerae bacterium]|jgi:molybdopterin-containing oxidoreductase family iron-sulfur binding subunit
MSENIAGKAYWRSLDELADAPAFRAFVAAEFPTLARDWGRASTRRQFLKLMGASFGLAGLAGCRWPKEEIAPFAKRPAGRTPGVPVQYATAFEVSGAAQGLLVTSIDGRPIKIEGNPLHPLNRGATDIIAQASILELYDPDRASPPRQIEAGAATTRTWDEFADFAKKHFTELKERGGRGLAVLTEGSNSPSLADMRTRFLAAFPAARWYAYEPVSDDNERAGTALLFGEVHRPHYALAHADVIVSFEADLLGIHPVALAHTRDFTASRDVDEHGQRRDGGGRMSRLYVVESAYSLTGGMADHRYIAAPSAIPAALAALGRALLAHGLTLPAPLAAVLGEAHGEGGVAPAAIEAMAADLLAARGRGVIAVGPRQPAEVHALAHALNEALGNVGQTVTFTVAPEPQRPPYHEAIATLAAEMKQGAVDTIVILGGNPAYDAPADVDFAAALKRVATSIHLGLHADETSAACTWHLPRAHYLESWDDARAYDGTLSIVQPLIAPLHDGRTPIELLALLTGEEKTGGYDLVRRTMQQFATVGDFESFWQQALHDGLVVDSRWPVATPAGRTGDWTAKLAGLMASPSTAPADRVEVAFVPDYCQRDGRWANNGWLQEMPDPLTKLTWDNAALLAPATAAALHVETGDELRLEADGRTLEIAAFVQPGHAVGIITLPLGYGRTAAGRIGDGVGRDTYSLRTTISLDGLRNVRVARTGKRHVLATTQDHQAMDSAVGHRETQRRVGVLVREATLAEYTHEPDFAKHAVHHPPLVSLWQEHEFTGAHRWAMAIDLNRCTGCGACLVACQAENNIPVVGKDEVRRGREMHWLRLDRYYRGDPADPAVVHQPVTCHHCETAPCEQVCPVAATAHSEEGLNDMVYNRCIGTRYCSNNCPFKVRRFNWFNNWRNLSEERKLAFNPQVTVRSRGVMEKCTYCVQRIAAVRIAAKNEGRPVADGEIVPACAQVCPAGAVVFGDLNDPKSRVALLHERDRAYAMLEELNIKPRTRYLAKLRNPAAGLGPATPTHGGHD